MTEMTARGCSGQGRELQTSLVAENLFHKVTLAFPRMCNATGRRKPYEGYRVLRRRATADRFTRVEWRSKALVHATRVQAHETRQPIQR